MTTPDADPGDVAEQARDAVPAAVTADPPLPDDPQASEADVVDQTREVVEDDEYR